MSADVIPFGRGMQVLRGVDAELERQARIGLRRRAAFRAAMDGRYSVADQAMFGPAEQIMREGPQTHLTPRPPFPDHGPAVA